LADNVVCWHTTRSFDSQFSCDILLKQSRDIVAAESFIKAFFNRLPEHMAMQDKAFRDLKAALALRMVTSLDDWIVATLIRSYEALWYGRIRPVGEQLAPLRRLRHDEWVAAGARWLRPDRMVLVVAGDGP